MLIMIIIYLSALALSTKRIYDYFVMARNLPLWDLEISLSEKCRAFS